jgi:DNA-binding NtrC family response regulator
MVESAASGEEALGQIGETHYALVLTDLGMSGVDGVALTEAIRLRDPETVVVWITAYGCHRFRQDAERLGVVHCLDKPVTLDRMRRTIHQALGTIERS